MPLLSKEHGVFDLSCNPPAPITVKPRVLIADDSRIVRATLIKHIEGLFEFREAVDGEQAWETLLLDPGIRVVITDLTMPKLDGYGLLERIRGSKVGRIRDIPVIVISGSDERQEHDRAKNAGATDLITKGIDTAQLLSRLDILSELANGRRGPSAAPEAEIADDGQVHGNEGNVNGATLSPLAALRAGAEALLARSLKNRKEFAVLHVFFGPEISGKASDHISTALREKIGALVLRGIRQTDLAAKFSDDTFVVVAESINADSAHQFAQRICDVIDGSGLKDKSGNRLVAVCGLASLSERGAGTQDVTFAAMSDLAEGRCLLGKQHRASGVIDASHESLLLSGENRDALVGNRARRQSLGVLSHAGFASPGITEGDAPDLSRILQWIKEGREDRLAPHLEHLKNELQPLITLLAKKL